MKSFFLYLLLPLISISFWMTGCVGDLDVDTPQDVAANFDVIPCDDLETIDLDLSRGFTGQSRENSAPGMPEFSILNHEARYDFPPAMVPGGCGGLCAINVEFTPKDGYGAEDFANLTIENIQMSYPGTNGHMTEISVGNSYSWQYPNLEIYVVAINTAATYEIDFFGEEASNLTFVETTVESGLCVVENLDLADPTIAYIVQPSEETVGAPD